MAGWQDECVVEDGGRIHCIMLSVDGRTLSWSEVVGAWQSTPEFADWFTGLLTDAPFEAFFWETPPLTSWDWNTPFQCVLVDSPALAGIRPEPGAFANHFTSASAVASFENLGGDAYLIAPCPDSEGEGYPHLASFLRTAPRATIRSLWRAVGVALDMRVGTRALWCSTSGLGIHWLHVRLDSRPKYYTYRPFREFHLGGMR